jgi:hypothetical protein
MELDMETILHAIMFVVAFAVMAISFLEGN